MNAFVNPVISKKWDDVLKESISDEQRKSVTAQLLENAYKEWDTSSPHVKTLNEAAPGNNSAVGIDKYDPVLIKLIRRTTPKLISFDVMGVQPLTTPTGSIFAQRPYYNNTSGAEAFYNEANTGFSTVTGGNTEIVGDASGNLGTTPSGNSAVFNTAGGMSLAQAEALGTSGNTAWPTMAMGIDKVTVEAKTRKLKAEYTTEFEQDLKSVHNLNAQNEVISMLSNELVAEINREMIRTILVTASSGSQTGTAVPGVFNLDVDSNGRWLGEKQIGLAHRIDLEANAVAKATRRGKGNILIASSDVASALASCGKLNYDPANAKLTVDDTGVSFVGTLATGMKVYIDPYAASNWFVVAYKGQNIGDAGLFYAPYMPMQRIDATNQDSLQKIVGLQTRYGLVANPFSKGGTVSDGSLEANSNVFYRRSLVTNLM